MYLVNVLADTPLLLAFRTINTFDQRLMSNLIHIRNATETGGILSQKLDSISMTSRKR